MTQLKKTHRKFYAVIGEDEISKELGIAMLIGNTRLEIYSSIKDAKKAHRIIRKATKDYYLKNRINIQEVFIKCGCDLCNFGDAK